VARGVEMLGHRKSRNVVPYASQVFIKATSEASSCLSNVKKWTTAAKYAIHNILGLAGEHVPNMKGAFREV